jgi:hypothetical protein
MAEQRQRKNSWRDGQLGVATDQTPRRAKPVWGTNFPTMATPEGREGGKGGRNDTLNNGISNDPDEEGKIRVIPNLSSPPSPINACM